MKKTILVAVAHGDDETWAMGTLAKYAQNGYYIYLLIATNGEKGWIDPKYRDNIVEIRKNEIRKAANILGIKEVIFWDYPDCELVAVSALKLREKFIKIIRQTQAQILFTWDPWAHYESQPDHRVIGLAACEASWFSGFSSFYPHHLEEGLRPHTVGEVYYFAKYPIKVDKIIDITSTIDKKIKAFCQYESQIILETELMKKKLIANNIEAPLLKMAHLEQYMEFWQYRIKNEAAEIGRRIGVPFGEEFRYDGKGRLADLFGAEEDAAKK